MVENSIGKDPAAMVRLEMFRLPGVRVACLGRRRGVGAACSNHPVESGVLCAAWWGYVDADSSGSSRITRAMAPIVTRILVLLFSSIRRVTSSLSRCTLATMP